jgi:RNA polymerase sigma-70 factor (ECF subfamily)
MASIQFNNLIYTASKNLKYPSVKISSAEKKANDLIQNAILSSVKNKGCFEVSLKNLVGYTKKSVSTTSTPNFTTTTSYSHNAGISQILSSMDKQFSVPFMMHFSGFKVEQIAKDLNISVEVVNERIQSARKILMGQ